MKILGIVVANTEVFSKLILAEITVKKKVLISCKAAEIPSQKLFRKQTLMAPCLPRI